MQLAEQVISKINELGIEGAAKFFNNKESTIKMWLKTKNIPLAACQQVLDSQGVEPSHASLSDPHPNPETAMSVAGTSISISPREVLDRVAEVNARVLYLEQTIAQVIPPPPSGIRPTIPNVPLQSPMITGQGGLAPSFEQVNSQLAGGQTGTGLPARGAEPMHLQPGQGNMTWHKKPAKTA